MADNFPNKQFLIAKIEPLIDSFSSKAKWRRTRSYYSSLSIAILAAVNALLLGLKIKEWDEYVRIITLVLSGVISVVNFYVGFFKDKQLWVSYNDASNSLKALKLRIESKTMASDLSRADFDVELSALQTILDNINKYWDSQNKG